MRRFDAPGEDGRFPPETPIGRDSPDPNWAMPGFLREAFRRRAMELIREAQSTPSEPIKASFPFSIEEAFAEPADMPEYQRDDSVPLELLSPAEELAIELFAKPDDGPAMTDRIASEGQVR